MTSAYQRSLANVVVFPAYSGVTNRHGGTPAWKTTNMVINKQAGSQGFRIKTFVCSLW
jgi:hypothetical protein